MLRSCWNIYQYIGPLAQRVVWTYRFVHQTESNLGVPFVLSRELRPKASELGVGRASLPDDRTIPASVVVNVDDTKGGTGVQASLDLLVIGREVVGVKVTTKVVVEQELPSDGDSECIQAIIGNEVLHLVDASLTWVGYTAGLACTIDGAAKVKSCNLSRYHY